MPRKRWIKLWTQETLYGTTFKELEADERAVWFGFLALAGDSPVPGTICVSPEVPYTRTQMCQILNVKRSLLNRAIDKMFHHGKINLNGDGCFTIVGWTHYQGDYVRVQQYRERERERYESNEAPDVTNQTAVVTEGTEQNRTEEEEDQTRTDDNTYGVLDIHERYFGPAPYHNEGFQERLMRLQRFPIDAVEAAYQEAALKRSEIKSPAGWVLAKLEAEQGKVEEPPDWMKEGLDDV